MTAVVPPPAAERGWARVVEEADRLGSAVEDALGGALPDETSFADVATRVMADVQPDFTADDMVACLLTAADYPDQADPASQYGEPGVTLWRGAGFFIDAYLHVTPNTSVHSHSFPGAFMVASGVSAHVRYELPAHEEVATGVVVGDLVVAEAEALEPGQVRPIPPGFGLIHSVVHVDRPTLSIVVRMPGTEDNAMFGFFLPGLGVRLDAAYTTVARKKMLLLDTLLRIRDPLIGARMVTLLDNVADASAITLAGKYTPWEDAPHIAEILNRTRHRDAPWVTPLLRAVAAGSFASSGANEPARPRDRMAAYTRARLAPDVAASLMADYDART